MLQMWLLLILLSVIFFKEISKQIPIHHPFERSWFSETLEELLQDNPEMEVLEGKLLVASVAFLLYVISPILVMYVLWKIYN